MMRSVGRFVGQARGLARQFQDSMNDAAREADLQEFRDARKLLKGGKSGVTDMLNETLDDDDDTPAKPKNRVLTAEESRQRAEESGFGASKDTPEEPTTEPLSAAQEDTPRTADAKSG
jgi:sec-independent protein translocase protein TatB